MSRFSDGVLISYSTINKMATDGGGGMVDGRGRWFQARYLSRVKYPHLSHLFFYVNIDVYEFVYVAKFFHHRSFVFFLTLCDSVQSVTSDWASLHIFVETSTSGSRRFKPYAPCSLLVSSCFWFRSHNFSFIIQFTSNRLLLHIFHHINLPQLFPQITSTAYATIWPIRNCI